MGTMFRLKLYCFILAVFLSSAFFGVHNASARNANGVLMQTSNGLPVWDKNIANDAMPNNKGVSFVWDALVDEVDHRLFVSDFAFYRIMIYQLDASNTFAGTDRSADFVLGRSSLTSYATTTADKQLNAPRGMTYDPVRKYLYVADTGNNRVLVYDGSDGWTDNETPINVYGQTSLTDIAVGGCTQTGLSGPYSVAYNSASDTIFVADEGHDRVLSFPATTSTASNPATTGSAINVIGKADFTSCTAPVDATVGTSTLWGPAGLAINTTTNKLYVADAHAGRVVVYNLSSLADGMAASQVFGKSSFTNLTSAANTTTFARRSTWTSPSDVEIDTASNTLYVVDSNSFRIMVFDASTTTVKGASAMATLGYASLTPTVATSLTQSGFNYPEGIGFSPSTKYLYVGDYANARVMIFDVNSITNGENAIDGVGQIDGSGNPVYTTNYKHNTTPNSIGSDYPRSLALDPIHHHLFESESNNNRILVFDLDNNNNLGTSLADLTADHVIGQLNFTDKTAARTASGLSNPQHIVFDPVSSTLYVGENGNARVTAFDVSNITTNGMEAFRVFGQPDFTTYNTGVTQSKMWNAMGMAYDSVNKRLFVGDSSNVRIMVFDSKTTTNGGPAINVLGQINFASTTSATTQSGIKAVYGFDYDTVSSTLFLDDATNNRVLIYDLSGGITNGMNASYVLGQPSFTSSTAGVSTLAMNLPFGVKYVPEQKKLFVSEHNNNRVTVFDGSDGWTNNEAAIGVIGQNNFTDSTGAVSQSGLQNPTGIDYDTGNNRLWIGDQWNYRVMYYNLITLPTSTLSTGYLGLTYSATLPTPTNYQETLSWSVSSGTLPSGLSLNTTTGVISGTPSATGTTSFDIRATETGLSGIYYDTQTFSITINTPTVSLSASSYSGPENTLGSPFILTTPTTSAYNISVTFAINDGATAVNGTNYSYSTTTATIPAGSLTAAVPLTIIHNRNVETDKTLSITISNPVSSSLGSITTASLTIQNVDYGGSGIAVSAPVVVVPPVTPPTTNPAATTGETSVTPPNLVTTANQSPNTVTVYEFVNTLKTNSTGTEVKELQQALKDLGYFKYPTITGFYGPVTAQAVKDFQTDNNLPITGKLDNVTITALNTATGSDNNAPTVSSATTASNATITNQTTATAVFTNILSTQNWPSTGSTGTNVRSIQQLLIDLGYLKISKPTGNFLSMTKQAVINFQRDNNIRTTGNVGPLTAEAMRERVSSKQ